jgi:hypothetical protein
VSCGAGSRLLSNATCARGLCSDGALSGDECVCPATRLLLDGNCVPVCGGACASVSCADGLVCRPCADAAGAGCVAAPAGAGSYRCVSPASNASCAATASSSCAATPRRLCGAEGSSTCLCAACPANWFGPGCECESLPSEAVRLALPEDPFSHAVSRVEGAVVTLVVREPLRYTSSPETRLAFEGANEFGACLAAVTWSSQTFSRDGGCVRVWEARVPLASLLRPTCNPRTSLPDAAAGLARHSFDAVWRTSQAGGGLQRWLIPFSVELDSIVHVAASSSARVLRGGVAPLGEPQLSVPLQTVALSGGPQPQPLLGQLLLRTAVEWPLQLGALAVGRPPAAASQPAPALTPGTDHPADLAVLAVSVLPQTSEDRRLCGSANRSACVQWWRVNVSTTSRCTLGSLAEPVRVWAPLQCRNGTAPSACPLAAPSGVAFEATVAAFTVSWATSSLCAAVVQSVGLSAAAALALRNGSVPRHFAHASPLTLAVGARAAQTSLAQVEVLELYLDRSNFSREGDLALVRDGVVSEFAAQRLNASFGEAGNFIACASASPDTECAVGLQLVLDAEALGVPRAAVRTVRFRGVVRSRFPHGSDAGGGGGGGAGGNSLLVGHGARRGGGAYGLQVRPGRQVAEFVSPAFSVVGVPLQFEDAPPPAGEAAAASPFASASAIAVYVLVGGALAIAALVLLICRLRRRRARNGESGKGEEGVQLSLVDTSAGAAAASDSAAGSRPDLLSHPSISNLRGVERAYGFLATRSASGELASEEAERA